MNLEVEVIVDTSFKPTISDDEAYLTINMSENTSKFDLNKLGLLDKLTITDGQLLGFKKLPEQEGTSNKFTMCTDQTISKFPSKAYFYKDNQ